MDEETIFKLKENYKKLSDQQLVEMFSYGKEAYEEGAWDLIVKEAMSRKLKLPLTTDEFEGTKKSVSPKVVKTPSLKAVILTPIIYLFGSSAIGFVMGAIGSDYPGMMWSAPLLFLLFITIILLKKYNGYFFSGSWQINFYGQLKTGLIWSIPFFVLTVIGAVNPEIRDSWLESYFMLTGLERESITNLAIILISAGLLVATFLEELIFRGMIQQYIKKFQSPTISVFISAGIFSLAGLWHTPGLGVVRYFLLGILYGFAFNKTNSCISSFVPHLMLEITRIVIVPLMLAF